MNTVINKFYTGDLNKFGFGTWNSGEQNLKLKVNKNPPIPITQYQPVNNYRPIPKTMSSMPNMLSTSQFITIQFRPEVPNPGPPPQTNYNTKYTAEGLKMQLLEEKIRQMEKEAKSEKDNIRDLVAMGQIPYQQVPQQQNMIPQQPTITMNPMIDKRAERRQEIKFEIEQARKKLKGYNSDSDLDDIGDEESEESEEGENSPEDNNTTLIQSPGFRKRKNTVTESVVSGVSEGKNTAMVSPPLNRSQRKSVLMSNGLQSMANQGNSTMLSKRKSVSSKTKAEDEAQEFVNNIPNHIAFQLQGDNFRVRENLAMIKASFRDIRMEKAKKANKSKSKDKSKSKKKNKSDEKNEPEEDAQPKPKKKKSKKKKPAE